MDSKDDLPPTKQNSTRRHTRAHTYTESDLSTSESNESEPQEKPEPSYSRYECAYNRGLARGPAITVLEKIKETEVRPHFKVDRLCTPDPGKAYRGKFHKSDLSTSDWTEAEP